MNFLGMGPLEIVLILVIAFIFLGPERMVDAARLLGKAVREGRRLATELPRVVIEDDEIKVIDPRRSPGSDTARRRQATDDEAPAEEDGPDHQERPVSFRPGDSPPPPRDSAGEGS